MGVLSGGSREDSVLVTALIGGAFLSEGMQSERLVYYMFIFVVWCCVLSDVFYFCLTPLIIQ